jgi:hypothetical protein
MVGFPKFTESSGIASNRITIIVCANMADVRMYLLGNHWKFQKTINDFVISLRKRIIYLVNRMLRGMQHNSALVHLRPRNTAP